jgi:hypothetical protein
MQSILIVLVTALRADETVLAQGPMAQCCGLYLD